MAANVLRTIRRLLQAALILPVALAAQRQGPTNVVAAVDGKGSVTISWTGIRDRVTYRVVRAPDQKSPGEDLTAPLGSTVTSFVDTRVTQGATYFYRVIAVYRDGSEGASIAIQFPAPPAQMPAIGRALPTGKTSLETAPVAAPTPSRSLAVTRDVFAAKLAETPRNPSGFTATAGAGGNVVLMWTPVPNAVNYNLQGPGVQTGLVRPGAVPQVDVTGTTYTVKGLPAGTHSWVLFTMYGGPSGPVIWDAANPSRVSLTVTANPSGFTATAGAGGDVILRWNPVSGVASYNLQGPGVQPGLTRPGTAAGALVYTTGTTYTVKGLPAGTHTWGLFSVYSGPAGPYFGDENNPARTSITIAPLPAASTTARRTSFDPATHGFRFVNSFKNNFIGPPVSLETRGLCGGMSYAALDFYNAGRQTLNQSYRPANNTPLQMYLYGRQVTSLTMNVDKWLEVSVNPFGTRSTEFFNWGINERLRELKSFIDRGVPIPLGLKGSEGNLSHDHQVLAIGYDAGRYQGDLGAYIEDLKIYILDPNHPSQTVTLVPNPGAKEYYALQYPGDRWRTYFVDSRYARMTPPNIVNPNYPNDGLVRELLFELSTGPDDMRGGPDHVDVTITLTDNTSQYYPNISQNGRWLPLYTETAQVILSQPVLPARIRTIAITTNAANDITGDNWDLLSVKVKAVGGGFTRDLLSGPAGPWRFTGARLPLVIDVK